MNDKKKQHPKKERELSTKQKAFIDEYLVDYNGKQAAIRAGYKPSNAEMAASKLLSKGKVSEAVALKIAERSRRTGITADRVLQELARIAFADIPAIVDLDTAELKQEASADERAVIAGVKVRYIPRAEYNEETGAWDKVTVVEREIKINDKMRALDTLCKHLGITEAAKKEAAQGGADGQQAAGVIQIPLVDCTIVAPMQPPQDDTGSDTGDGQQQPTNE